MGIFDIKICIAGSNKTPISIVSGGQHIFDPKLTLEADASGSLEFTIDETNVNFYRKIGFGHEIEMFENSEEYPLFSGRMAETKMDYYGRQTIYCEGPLSYLQDTVFFPTKKTYDNPYAFISEVIGYHNLQINSSKTNKMKNKLLYVETKYITYKSTTKIDVDVGYEKSWDVLKRYLIDKLGGHLFVKYGGRDKNGYRKVYIVYSNLYPFGTHNQTIEISKNLIDFQNSTKIGDHVNGIIPYCRNPKYGEEGQSEYLNITVASAKTETITNSGVTNHLVHEEKSNWIYNQEDMANYGCLFQAVQYDNIETPEALLDAAFATLKTVNYDPITVSVNAVDLNYVKPRNYSAFKLGYRAQVIAKNYNQTIPITKVEIDMSKGTKKITLGLSNKKRSKSIYGRTGGTTGANTTSNTSSNAASASLYSDISNLMTIAGITASTPSYTASPVPQAYLENAAYYAHDHEGEEVDYEELRCLQVTHPNSNDPNYIYSLEPNDRYDEGYLGPYVLKNVQNLSEYANNKVIFAIQPIIRYIEMEVMEDRVNVHIQNDGYTSFRTDEEKVVAYSVADVDDREEKFILSFPATNVFDQTIPLYTSCGNDNRQTLPLYKLVDSDLVPVTLADIQSTEDINKYALVAYYVPEDSYDRYYILEAVSTVPQSFTSSFEYYPAYSLDDKQITYANLKAYSNYYLFFDKGLGRITFQQQSYEYVPGSNMDNIVNPLNYYYTAVFTNRNVLDQGTKGQKCARFMIEEIEYIKEPEKFYSRLGEDGFKFVIKFPEITNPEEDRYLQSDPRGIDPILSGFTWDYMRDSGYVPLNPPYGYLIRDYGYTKNAVYPTWSPGYWETEYVSEAEVSGKFVCITMVTPPELGSEYRNWRVDAIVEKLIDVDPSYYKDLNDIIQSTIDQIKNTQNEIIKESSNYANVYPLTGNSDNAYINPSNLTSYSFSTSYFTGTNDYTFNLSGTPSLSTGRMLKITNLKSILRTAGFNNDYNLRIRGNVTYTANKTYTLNINNVLDYYISQKNLTFSDLYTIGNLYTYFLLICDVDTENLKATIHTFDIPYTSKTFGINLFSRVYEDVDFYQNGFKFIAKFPEWETNKDIAASNFLIADPTWITETVNQPLIYTNVVNVTTNWYNSYNTHTVPDYSIETPVLLKFSLPQYETTPTYNIVDGYSIDTIYRKEVRRTYQNIEYVEHSYVFCIKSDDITISMLMERTDINKEDLLKTYIIKGVKIPDYYGSNVYGFEINKTVSSKPIGIVSGKWITLEFIENKYYDNYTRENINVQNGNYYLKIIGIKDNNTLYVQYYLYETVHNYNSIMTSNAYLTFNGSPYLLKRNGIILKNSDLESLYYFIDSIVHPQGDDLSYMNVAGIYNTGMAKIDRYETNYIANIHKNYSDLDNEIVIKMPTIDINSIENHKTYILCSDEKYSVLYSNGTFIPLSDLTNYYVTFTKKNNAFYYKDKKEYYDNLIIHTNGDFLKSNPSGSDTSYFIKNAISATLARVSSITGYIEAVWYKTIGDYETFMTATDNNTLAKETYDNVIFFQINANPITINDTDYYQNYVYFPEDLASDNDDNKRVILIISQIGVILYTYSNDIGFYLVSGTSSSFTYLTWKNIKGKYVKINYNGTSNGTFETEWPNDNDPRIPIYVASNDVDIYENYIDENGIIQERLVYSAPTETVYSEDRYYIISESISSTKPTVESVSASIPTFERIHVNDTIGKDVESDTNQYYIDHTSDFTQLSTMSVASITLYLRLTMNYNNGRTRAYNRTSELTKTKIGYTIPLINYINEDNAITPYITEEDVVGKFAAIQVIQGFSNYKWAVTKITDNIVDIDPEYYQAIYDIESTDYLGKPIFLELQDDNPGDGGDGLDPVGGVTTIDINTLTEAGTYYIPNTNDPEEDASGWLMVANIESEDKPAIRQMFLKTPSYNDSSDQIIYTRIRDDSYRWSEWVSIGGGGTEVDLSAYYTSSQVDSKISTVNSTVSNKYDKTGGSVNGSVTATGTVSGSTVQANNNLIIPVNPSSTPTTNGSIWITT